MAKLLKAMTDILELPSDIMMSLPKIEIIGNMEATIENHRGLLEYTTEQISIRGNKGITLILRGRKLRLKRLCKEEITIQGFLLDIEFSID